MTERSFLWDTIPFVPLSGKTRREVLTEFRQGEILAAATKVFAAKGFRDATLEAIAEAAGMAKGTLYLYFESKEEIFAAALRSRLVEMQARVGEALAELGARGATTREKIRAALRARFEMARRDEEFWRIHFTEFGHLCLHSGPAARQFRDLHLESARQLAPVLAEGMKRGEVRRAPPLETAMALIDLTRSTVALSLLGLHESKLDLEAFVFDLFWRGVAARGEDKEDERGEAGRGGRGTGKGNEA